MKRTGYLKSSTWLMGAIIVGVFASCGSDGGGGEVAGGSSQLGSLHVSLTDAPACGFDAVNVTVDRVRVHQSSSVNESAAGWRTIAVEPPRKINLLDLNDPTQAPKFALESLGEAPLEAGHYTQVRLVLVPNRAGSPLANTVVLTGTTSEIPLETPSAVQSGIKLHHQFTVNPEQRVDLLLDFDACKSIVKTGNNKYKLKPVIKVIPSEMNGIQGYVDKNVLASHVVVSAQINGEVVRATVPNPSTGKFFLAHLGTPANYDVVVTADDRAAAIIAGVPLTNRTEVTLISTDGAPITLNASSMQSIGGIVALNPQDDDAHVTVTAKQTLVGGPTVTIRSQTASLDTGGAPGDYGYILTQLPVAAPSLGTYSISLPITVTTDSQSSVAGRYSLKASARTLTTVYATQSPSDAAINITEGSQTLNLALTP